MIPPRPSAGSPTGSPRTIGYDETPKGTKRTVGYEDSPARPAGAPAPIKRTVGYDEITATAVAGAPGKAPSGGLEATVLGDSDPALTDRAPAPAFAATLLGGVGLATEKAPVSGFASTMLGGVGPIDEKAPVSGFESTLLGGTEMLHPPAPAAPAAPPASLVNNGTTQGTASSGAPASLGSSMSRSTVLPRVEVLDGQPRISRQDRPRYQERKRLGEGGVGEVVMVNDNDIERVVAMKRLRPGLQGTTALARFVEEIRVVGQLEHPSIIPIHDVGLDDQGQFFFVMKYVNGETIENIIEKLAANDPEYHRRYPFERRVEIFLGILEAMSYAHDKGYIHRDIKPANIMVGPYGEVVVMDWGLAKKAGTSNEMSMPEPESQGGDEIKKSGRLQETRLGSLLGTPLYMSPEQARGQHATLDQRSDIYSLSVLFFELLSLRHYLDDCKDLAQVLHSIANGQPPLAGTNTGWGEQTLQGPVPADLRHFVVKGLHKDPARRYASVHEMIARLRARAEGEIPIECPVTFWISFTARARRTLSRHPLTAASLMVLFALTTVASVLFSLYSAMHMMRA